MVQRTRQGIERGEFQGTAQEVHRNQRSQISSVRKGFPEGRTSEDKFQFVLDELDKVWASQRGGGGADVDHPDMLASHGSDQRGRPTRLWDPAAETWIEGTTISSTLSDLENDARKLWVPASSLFFNTTLTPPAAHNATAGGARLGTLDFPQNTSAAMHSFYQTPMPRLWQGVSGTLSVKIPYAISVGSSDTFSIRASIWSYEAGDGLTTPSATEFNETMDSTTALATTEQWYERTSEAAVTLDDTADWLAIRISRLGQTAADTYTGTVRILGALFNLEI